MLNEEELVEAMAKERHRTLKIWKDAVKLRLRRASGVRYAGGEGVRVGF